MQSSDLERDEALRAKRREAEPGPQADRPNRLGWASALGNAAVQRLLRSVGVQRSGAGPNALDESIARDIQSKRGTGQSLDTGARRQMEASMGQDFSDVRVHTDSEADGLNKAVKADAFTTGKDVFFREGKYNPGSSEGSKLLAHELTHVVQQQGAPTGGSDLTVSSPDDASERQAGAVAEQVGSPAGAGAAVGRQPIEEEEEELQASPAVDRQEEEEELQMSPSVDRQEEEEELQMSPSVDRQEEEEEVQMSPAVDRQEEEELQMSPAVDRQEEEEEELQMSPSVDRRSEKEAQM